MNLNMESITIGECPLQFCLRIFYISVSVVKQLVYYFLVRSFFRWLTMHAISLAVVHMLTAATLVPHSPTLILSATTRG